MSMTDAQLRRAEDWFAEKLGSRACTECSGNSFVVHPDLLALPTINRIGNSHAELATDSGAGVVAIKCNTCGNVRLFAATTIGIVKRLPDTI